MKDLIDCWTISESECMPDQQNGGVMMRITFINLHNQIKAQTYVCPANDNSSNWTTVLELIGNDRGVIVSDIKTTKRKNKLFVNADSLPIVEWQGNPKTLQVELENLWLSKNTFKKFFE